MKKWIAMLLSVTLLLGLSLPSALAAGEPTVTLSSGEATAGESVTLKVSIRDNPGLAAFMLHLYYDTSVFTVDVDEGIEGVGKFGSSGTVVCSELTNGMTVLWFNGSGRNVRTDGDVLTVTLKASSGAASGDYTVQLSYDGENTLNEDEQPVELTTVSATVTITGGVEGAVPPVIEEPVSFTDIDGHWAEAEILKSAELGLVNGYPDGTYSPDNTMTRAECVTILWRASGSPKPKAAPTFTDLDPIQQWYWDAVAWAAENGVVNGVGDGKFDPTGNVTREQLVTILHRMAGNPVGLEQLYGPQYDANHPDSDQTHDWARNAVHWAIFKSIYCGEDSLNVGVELKPTAYATRAQIAVMMVRYLDKY